VRGGRARALRDEQQAARCQLECSLCLIAIAGSPVMRESGRDARARRDRAAAHGAAGTGFGLAFARYDEPLKGASTLTLLGPAQYGTLKRQG
jgi:hypothetical protein